jgi:hypothetical protein
MIFSTLEAALAAYGTLIESDEVEGGGATQTVDSSLSFDLFLVSLLI